MSPKIGSPPLLAQLPSSPYIWVDTAGLIAGPRFYRAIEGPTNVVWLTPGTFTMGSPSNEVQRYDLGRTADSGDSDTGFFHGEI